ncbi:MAG: Hsp20/alpha crystallin family protein [Acidobacteriota bacterium]
MKLVRYNPMLEWRGMDSLMDRFFNDNFSEVESQKNSVLTPAADVTETENELVFTTELPGFEKGEVGIAVHDGRLTITAERKYEEPKEARQHQIERWYGKFHRSFLLPKSADPEKISAKLKKGVLTVSVPKKEEAKPRQIPVTVN